MTNDGLEIYGYCDHRLFLESTYCAKKKANTSWSYSVWAKQLGLKTKSTLIMVLKGQRLPSEDLTEKLAKYLKLSKKEEEYFFDLVHLAKCRSNKRLSVTLLEKISKSHRGVDSTFLDSGAFSSISCWYYYAIREMVQLPDFKYDVNWITNKLQYKVSTTEVRHAVKTLLRLKLLRQDHQGNLKIAQANINTSSDVADEGLKRFHEGILEKARAAVRTSEPKQRQISGTTFVMNRENMFKAKEMLRKFQDDFTDLFESKTGNSVFHFELALFPLTKPHGEKDS